MPIFEYHCENCDCDFEEIVLDDQDPPCPKCGQHKAKRLMSTAVTRSGSQRSTAGAACAPTSARSGCGGCSGGNCSTCH